jgi:protein-tyrosine phosphatase
MNKSRFCILNGKFLFIGMIPDNVGAFTHLLSQIRKRVADGYRVLAHCFGGLGRAVLLGACLMLSLDQVCFVWMLMLN